MIRSVTIVTSQGVNTYEVGVSHFKIGPIEKIVRKGMYINDDLYEHYIGYDDSGKMLFTINCLVPCEVIYYREA